MCPKKNNNDNINENTNQKNTSYQGDDFLKEYNNAIFRAAHYEGNIENIIRDKVALILSSDSTPLKNKVIKHVVDKISEANQVFEFNHLGNLLMKSPAIKYIAMSFLRRILIKLSIAQKIDPTLKITKSSQDAGIGFLEGWSTEDKQWASQLNDLLKEGINPRVLTTLAYQYMKVFRDHTLLSSMGDEINIDLLKAKENNPRFDIFHRHEDNSTPVFSLPITTQPHGWPWLKYADWNSGNLIFKDKKSDFIAERITGDPHKGTGYNFQGMNNAIYPPLYKSNDFSLKEREKHESGYGGFIINDQSLHSYNNVTDISVNWRRQNSEKALPMLAGPSSTTSFMYEISRLLNMPANEVELFRLLLLSWMIQGRDHSFTEIMGALDAYAMEYEEKGPTSINIDEKMAWQARKTGEWHRSYENLISDDIMLPGLKSETIELNGQQIHLPALEEVKIEKINFESFLSDGKGFPSQYASDEYIISAAEYYKKNMEPEDEHGLANESILYAPQNNDNLKLYNYIPRQTPKRPEIEKPTQPYIDSDREIKLKNWLANLSQTKKMDLFNSSVFLLA